MIKLLIWLMLYCMVGGFFAIVVDGILGDDAEDITILIGFLCWPLVLLAIMVALIYWMVRRLWDD